MKRWSGMWVSRGLGLGGLSLGLLGLGACASSPPPPPPPPEPAVVAEPAPDPFPAEKKVAGDDPAWGITGDPVPRYADVVRKVEAMVGDPVAREGARRRGLDVVNVMWEDTGRAEGSALGPNISDFTLQVRQRQENGQWLSALMPVIRFPNFTDRTGDVKADKFLIRIGNQKAGGLESVRLGDVLKNLDKFVSLPASLGGARDLTAPRDTHYLVSAQAVFLPIPKQGKAEFNPVLFNYQSSPGSPAVLTLLVTRQGTSVKVIDGSVDRSPAGAGQELYFNAGGQKSAFTAERKADVEQRIAAQGGPKTEDDRSALAKGADVLFMVQIPLVHQQRGRLGGSLPAQDQPFAASAPKGAPMPQPKKEDAPADGAEGSANRRSREQSDVEQAVLGHGPSLGPYKEGIDKRLVRDPKFPIRITVQFYKATSNGVVNDKDLDLAAKNIGSVYEHADFVGSLVIPEGDARRPTEWQTIPNEWFPW
jgi:hypothetical protein